MAKIESVVLKQIRSLCEHAAKLLDMGEYQFSVSKYYEALRLVPDPKSEYDISTFIYAAMGEAYWQSKNFNEAGVAFLKAYKCPGGDQVGKISFRLGQCLEECGERKMAQDYLCQAYLLDGEEVFKSANPKYYKIIRSEIEGSTDNEPDFFSDSGDYDILSGILQKTEKAAKAEYTGSNYAYAEPSAVKSRPSSYPEYEDENERRRPSDFFDRKVQKSRANDDFFGEKIDEEEDYEEYDEYDDYDEDYDDEDEYYDVESNDNQNFWQKFVSKIRKFTDLFK